MIAKAKTRFLRLSPKKVRLVVDLVRGKQVDEALNILAVTNKGATTHVSETIKSAIANAKNIDEHMDSARLYISRIFVDMGPTLFRYRAASMGRASAVKHKFSHITVELDSKPVKRKVKSTKETSAKKVSKMKEVIKKTKAKVSTKNTKRSGGGKK